MLLLLPVRIAKVDSSRWVLLLALPPQHLHHGSGATLPDNRFNENGSGAELRGGVGAERSSQSGEIGAFGDLEESVGRRFIYLESNLSLRATIFASHSRCQWPDRHASYAGCNAWYFLAFWIDLSNRMCSIAYKQMPLMLAAMHGKIPCVQKLIESGANTSKSSFVEHRTFLHLYRSFHRMWIFLIIMFQILAIIAFDGFPKTLDRFKVILSIGPTFAIMNFIEYSLDILLMYGAYTTARGMAISRIIIRLFWWGLTSTFVTYIYWQVLEERSKHGDPMYFRIYVLVLGVYAAVRFAFALLIKFPCSHALSRMSDQPFFQFFKWIYQERYFVGRGLFESLSFIAKY